MQPLATVDVTRPWHWGIAIVSDPDLGGEIPDVDPSGGVSANEKGIIVPVRHAQDIESFEGDFEWAEATVTVRLWSDPPDVDDGCTIVFEGWLATPTERLWIGDADENTVAEGFPTSTGIRVALKSDDLDSPEQVWVDAWKA
jgi:hypothetical protein